MLAQAFPVRIYGRSDLAALISRAGAALGAGLMRLRDILLYVMRLPMYRLQRPGPDVGDPIRQVAEQILKPPRLPLADLARWADARSPSILQPWR
jgi:hypothetical protein